MAEGRRHSVDIPLSKTLVALKRVRSLRDPGTNSMSKFTPYGEHINWEINSGSGAFLELSNPDNDGMTMCQNDDLGVESEESGSNSDSNCCSNPKRSCSMKFASNRVSATRAKLLHESYQNHTQNVFDSAAIPYATNHLDEEVNSYNEPNFTNLPERGHDKVASKKSVCGGLKKSNVTADVAMSRVGSPCMSICEAHTNSLSHSTFGLAAEEIDIRDSNNTGCGINHCWSRSMPKYSNQNLSPDVDDQECPLLSAEGGEITNREIVLCPESPRSLSHKYRPRSFKDLVGQNVICQSLLNAIFKGRIAPIYLFYGPRGAGKSSTARIFAAALNCSSLEEHRPCGFCQECLIFFTGRSRDVKELDAAKFNHKYRVKALLKSASRVPFSSRFKVFIVEDCQFLHGQTWTAIFNCLDEVSQNVVFIMVTSELDNVPQNSTSRCRRYHFSKLKASDIVFRLQKICIEEGLDFDEDALDFIAAKSNGSLRDAEMLLDQLGLLGKRITVSLAYELIGVVSDDELLTLLELALSADTANTVKRARELMKSRVDPMQLISQLANLIMDVLAGRRQLRLPAFCENLVGQQTLTDVSMQPLKHALKILSETEKQLRTSKNQATWLTVALLQFSTEDSLYPRTNSLRDDGVLSTISPRESLKRCYGCGYNKSNCLDKCHDKKGLETIWRKAIANCPSNDLRNFLLKHGNLSSIYIHEGVAIAEVEFHHPDYVSRAEKSWKMIGSSLQYVINCNVEVRIQLAPSSARKNTKLKRPLFNILNCYGRKEMPDSTTNETEASLRRDASMDASSSYHCQQFSPFSHQLDKNSMHGSGCFHGKAVTTRSMEENNTQSCGTMELDEEGAVHANVEESEIQPSCFSKTLKFQRFLSSEVAQTICLRIQPHNKLELSFRKDAVFDKDFCTNMPYVFCSKSNTHITYNSSDNNGLSSDSMFSSNPFCWRASKLPVEKDSPQRRHQRGSHLVGWFLPCMTAEQKSQAEHHA